MLKREEYLKFVSDHLAVLESSVRRRGQLGLVDLNLIAETFFADVLNVVYGLKLRNLNLGRNKPGVDLGDDQARVAYQVTSIGTHEKMQKTIDRVIKWKLYEDYDQIRVLVIGTKQQRYTKTFETHGLFSFTPADDIVDVPDLIRDVNQLPTAELEQIVGIIRAEFRGADAEQQILGQSDREVLEHYRSAFNRPALQDPMWHESSLHAFETALTDLIGLLKKGELNGLLVTRKSDSMSDLEARKELDGLYHRVRALRGLYISYVRTGELDPDRNSIQFRDPASADTFDQQKQDVIDQLNHVLRRYGISEVRGPLR